MKADEDARRFMPRYCSACERGDWSLFVWKKGTNYDGAMAVRYSCRSWRHPGDCARWKGAQDFRRIEHAVKSFENWVYIVLTYDQSLYRDPTEQYVHGVQHWSILRKRLTRKFGPIRYIQTWERHKKGGSHVNVVISNRNLWDACSGDGWRKVRREVIRPAAVASGFGPVCWVEQIRTKKGMAGYLAKLSRELTGGSVKDQIPWDAPPHFRRIRASQGTLPPPIHSEEYTGKMMWMPEPFAQEFAAAARDAEKERRQNR